MGNACDSIMHGSPPRKRIQIHDWTKGGGSAPTDFLPSTGRHEMMEWSRVQKCSSSFRIFAVVVEPGEISAVGRSGDQYAYAKMRSTEVLNTRFHPDQNSRHIDNV